MLRQPIFEGTIYILVNGGTLSSAIDFASIYSDNDLATLVGEPVGDSPTSAGNVVHFTTPELKIPFQVSSALYTRADPSRDPADTLEPDIYLPLTVKDIQQKHDPVKAWLNGLE
jgi:C-terminal processing protease CtpA/Prc